MIKVIDLQIWRLSWVTLMGPVESHQLFFLICIYLFVKESACNSGDSGLIPALGRSLGEGNGYPLQYSYLENSMDRGAWLQSMGSQSIGHDYVTNSFTFTYLFGCILGLRCGKQNFVAACGIFCCSTQAL